jgi:hypothetical protein
MTGFVAIHMVFVLLHSTGVTFEAINGLKELADSKKFLE